MSSRSGGARRLTATRGGWTQTYESLQGRHIDGFAQDHGMTRAAYEQAVTDRMRELMAGARVYTRRSERAAALIATEGRFKTVHETGTSGGDTNDTARAQIERMLFGRAGTVYGYAGTPQSAKGSHGQYGNAIFEVKPSALRGASVTFNDTLNASGYEYRHDAYRFKQGVVPSPVNAPDYRTWDYRNYGDPLKWLDHPSRLAQYTEVQFPHGLGLSYIAHVYLENEPSAATAEALRKAGVPYSVTPWYSTTLG